MTEHTENTKKWFAGWGRDFVLSLGVSAGDRILDFGCGIGSYVLPLAAAVGAGGHVTAVDENERNISEIREKLGELEGSGISEIDIRHTDGSLEFGWLADGVEDGAFVFDVLQHVSDWGKLFGEVKRVLREGGRVYVNPSTLSHPGEVDMKVLHGLLAEMGFEHVYTRREKVMHYKHFAEDEIFVFELKSK